MTNAAARLDYEPGLDGLRAVALLAIFVVHADIGRATGAFLAVSTFFTLSGFLIMSLLVIEHGNTGAVGLRAFWGRRARRLLPAAVVAITAITCATAVIGSSGQTRRLFGDVVASLAYVANWRFIRFGDSYGAGFEGESPLLHFWSLAIEEQFYLAFPLLCAGAFSWKKRWAPAVPAALAGGVVASLSAGIVGASSGASVDRLYFGTDVRAAELLVGALLGLWWVPRRGHFSDAHRRLIRIAGPFALVVMLALIATAYSRDLVWYRGGLVAYALVTCVVILAAIESGGPVRALLASRPLAAVGLVSYGAYLAHWPVFVWLRTTTRLGGNERLLVGTIVAIALGALSYQLVERPVRERRLVRGPVLAGCGAVFVALALFVAAVPAPRWSAARDEGSVADLLERVPEALKESLAAPGEAPSVAVFGDSTALTLALGLGIWDDTHADVRVVRGWGDLGCSITSPAGIREGQKVLTTPAVCTNWFQKWTAAVSASRPDIALVMFGPWEVQELKPAGVDGFHVIGSPEIDEVIERNLKAGIEMLLQHAGIVVVATSPYIEKWRHDPPLPESEPARMDRLNAIIRRVAARYDRVAVIDLATFVARRPDDVRLRPDGIHFTLLTAREVSDFIGPTLAYVAWGVESPRALQPGSIFVLQRAKRAH